MNTLRALWVVIFAAVLVYTGLVVRDHGMGLFAVFFGDMAKMDWRGQFDLDFMCMLALSGTWVAFRHRFSAAGVLLGLCALFGGSLFLSVYLLVASIQAKGDVAVLLLGAGPATTGPRATVG